MKTLIVDNYDSFTYNLFQMVAAVNGSAPLVVYNDRLTWNEFERIAPDNVIISPGPGRPEHEKDFGVCRQILLQARQPVLGVCLGLQGLGYLFGGRIVHAPEPVHGRTSAIFHTGGGIFEGAPQGFAAVRYHSLMVERPIPECLRLTAWTADDVVMGLEHRQRPLWAVQFHPESICTEHGGLLLDNFSRLSRDLKQTALPDLLSQRNQPSQPSQPERSQQPGERKSPAPAAAKKPAVFTRKLDTHPSTEAAFHSLFADASPAFWLDAGTPPARQSRFSFMGTTAPDGAWISYSTAARRLTVHGREESVLEDVSLFDFLQAEIERRQCDAPELPFDFNGGFTGYFGYELKNECGGADAHRSPHPDACLMYADRVLAFDHDERNVYLVYAGEAGEAAQAQAWFDATEHRLRYGIRQPPPPHVQDESLHFRLERNRTEYLESIGRCLQWIRDGESYEICLTNRIAASTTVDAFDYYRTLRHINPAPYSAFLRFPGLAAACSSPERFLRVDRNRMVEAKPIKGTLARGADAAADRALEEMLRNDVKMRSENLMIVDLLRHDLGRVCETGSIRVPQMMQVETYTNLHQLVSTVQGRLRADRSAADCVRSAFPGGSMTGAPKVRTMELIDRVEPSARGVYSGAIGFLAWNGTADLNIVIRTAVFADGRVSIGVGGAIVALSNPEREFEEALLKGRALVDAFREVVRSVDIATD